MKLTTPILLLAAALLGCTTPEARQRQEILRHQQYLEEQIHLTKVDLSDGISEVEAYKIGRDRFDTYQTACGVVSTPVDLGDSWRVTTCPGIAGIPFEDILIRKSDGATAITRAKVPDVPNQHLQAARDDLSVPCWTPATRGAWLAAFPEPRIFPELVSRLRESNPRITTRSCAKLRSLGNVSAMKSRVFRHKPDGFVVPVTHKSARSSVNGLWLSDFWPIPLKGALTRVNPRTITRLAFFLLCVTLCGCAGPDRQNIRRNTLATGQPQGAFLKEWGSPTRTYLEIVPASDTGKPYGSFSFGPGGGSGHFDSAPRGSAFDVWFYREHSVTLFFSTVDREKRLFAWIYGDTPAVKNPQNVGQ